MNSQQRNPGKVSTTVSTVLTVFLILALLVLLPWIPDVVTSMLDTADNIGDRASLPQSARTYVLVCAYVMYAVTLVTLTLFLLLIRAVRRGHVFEKDAILYLRLLSLCCFVEALLFFSIAFCFQLAIGVGLAAGILGVGLGVVRDVLAEAARIKAENEFTI